MRIEGYSWLVFPQAAGLAFLIRNDLTCRTESAKTFFQREGAAVQPPPRTLPGANEANGWAEERFDTRELADRHSSRDT
jgi:hypothetical protein